MMYGHWDSPEEVVAAYAGMNELDLEVELTPTPPIMYPHSPIVCVTCEVGWVWREGPYCWFCGGLGRYGHIVPATGRVDVAVLQPIEMQRLIDATSCSTIPE